MKVHVYGTGAELGQHAARYGATAIRRAIAARDRATIIVATGASQFEMLAFLVREELDWSRVTAFHLDEYVGLPVTHPASFRNYLRERFVGRLPNLGAFHQIDGEADPEQECRRVGSLIRERPVDVAFVGIGENGHLAFNDPPADFGVTDPYLVVTLDEACRRQQVGEGWFGSVDEVPARAISMSVNRIIASSCIVATVPDARKARAVLCAASGPVDPMCPASILQRHADCRLYLDRDSASLLPERLTTSR